MSQGPLVLKPDEHKWGVGSEGYQQYCVETPATLMLKSSSGYPLVLGCQKAAEECFVLEDGGMCASTRVEAESSTFVVVPETCAGCAHEMLPCFRLDLLTRQLFMEIKDWLSRVVCSLRSKGVLVYCKYGAEFSAIAMVLLLCHLTGEPVSKCVSYVRCLRVIADATR